MVILYRLMFPLTVENDNWVLPQLGPVITGFCHNWASFLYDLSISGYPAYPPAELVYGLQ